MGNINFKNIYIIRTQRPFHFSHGNFVAILKMLAHLSASIFTSKSNHYSLIGHGILLYNFHKYCMIYRLSMFEKLKNIMRDTVCRRFLHHIVLSYYIWDNVCRIFMRHIVVNYYIKATDVKKMVTRFVVNYYILPIDVNAVARQNVVITTFCNVTTFWVATAGNENFIPTKFNKHPSSSSVVKAD